MFNENENEENLQELPESSAPAGGTPAPPAAEPTVAPDAGPSAEAAAAAARERRRQARQAPSGGAKVYFRDPVTGQRLDRPGRPK